MILSNPFSQKEFTDFIKDFLPDFVLNSRKVEVGSSGFMEVLRLGESSSLMTSVLIVRSSKNINSRISLTNNSFKILKTHQIYRALIVYVNEDETIWRLSLLTALPTFDPTGKIIMSYSNPRRHSYVLGSDVGIATARKYLSNLGPVTDFDNLQFRFSVEAVNKDFYKEIAGHFYELIGKYGDNGKVIKNPALHLPGKKTRIEDLQNYSVRLLGRIIFVWFLNQKTSALGKSLLPIDLLTGTTAKQKNILHDQIEPLFFEVLNKQLNERESKFQKGQYAEVPYLNGGLFHATEGEAGDFYNSKTRKSQIEIPDSWFESLFQTLITYNFTIDENLENDVDLSIDPEMLGRVFENLLAEINPETGKMARKSSGSYYTPRKIVNFMVDNSIKQYLSAKTNILEQKIKALLTTSKLDDVENPLSESEKSLVVEAMKEFKILDPACGSGAFPMGLLQKIMWVLQEVDPTGENFLEGDDYAGTEHRMTSKGLDYLRKRRIIRDSIFGVDIQSFAVEIAKLRCFLTLIVDQEIDDSSPNRGIVPLPNLDFKFVVANTLVPLEKIKQMTFGDDPELEGKLLKIRNRYFTASTEEKKSKLRVEYEKLVSTQPSLFEESKRNTQLKTYRPLESNTCATFFDSVTMFGIHGFDVVIGNPPYVSADNMGNELKDTYKQSYISAKGKYDLYYLFYEVGKNLLSPSGVLSFITPNKFCAADSADELRTVLSKNTELEIFSLSKLKVFESAANYPLVVFVSKTQKDGKVKFREVSSLESLDESQDSGYEISDKQRLKLPAGVIPINIVQKQVDLIIGLLGTNRYLAKEISFSEGIRIKPEFELAKKNDYMIVKQYQFDQWLPVKEGTYIKKVDLEKVMPKTTDRYIKSMQTKILIAEDALKISATIDFDKYIPQGGIYFGVAENPWYVLGLLNSSLYSSMYKILFGGMHMGGGYLRYRKNFLEGLPLPEENEKSKEIISKLASEITNLAKEENDTKDLQQQLDLAVCEAFHLSEADYLSLITSTD